MEWAAFNRELLAQHELCATATTGKLLDWRPELIGVARYEPSDEEDTAEIAIVVQDYWQGRGVGAILLKELLRSAAVNSIRRFRAWVLPDNHRMLDFLARHTDVRRRRTEQGVVEILFTRRDAPAVG